MAPKASDNKTIVIVAVITSLAGLGTAVVNRISPNEPAAKVSYEVVKEAVSTVADDIDKLETRLREAEKELAVLKHSRGNRRPRSKMRKKRESLKKRVKMPDYSTVQRGRRK